MNSIGPLHENFFLKCIVFLTFFRYVSETKVKLEDRLRVRYFTPR